MKILLINPPNSGRSIPEERYAIDSIKQMFRGEPLALEVLAGNLADHQIRILDLKSAPDSLDQTFTDFAPDLVGFTAMTCEAQTVLALARQIKAKKQVTIVVGGVHASCDPHFFNDPAIDWIVIGIGKLSFAQLVSRLENGEKAAAIDIPGIARTAPGEELNYRPRLYCHDDLVEQAAPRYDLVKDYRDQYFLAKLGIQLGEVMTAAGCPYNCNFCCIAPLTGNRYLNAGIPGIIRDIGLLDTSPVIRLVDANSFGNQRRATELANAIIAAGLKKQFLADVRADTVVRHPELLKLWAQAGLRAVVIGFEEISDSALGAMNKSSDIACHVEAIRILHDLGITIVGDFIISPDYSEQQFDLLADFNLKQGIELPMYTVLTPLPGTALYQQMKSQIRIFDLDYYTLTNAVVTTALAEERFYRRYAELLQLGHQHARI